VPRGSIEISTFVPLTPENAPALEEIRPVHPLWAYLSARRSAIESRIPGAVMGAVVSVLLHVFLVTAVLWGVAAHSPHHPRDGLSGNAGSRSDDTQSMQWITIDMGPSSSTMAHPALHLTPQLTRVAPPTITSSAFADVAAELDSGFDSAAEGTELTALAGRYVGQIDARIGRAWLRPRTAIGAPRFSCRVRIDQSRTGEVLEVTLERCNGTARWQRSLVEAIESASPLPQPPEPSVFAPVVHMSFQALAYQPGMPAAQYEPLQVARATLVVPAQAGEAALGRFGQALEHAHANQVIRLTIVGGSPPAPTSPEPPPTPPERARAR
jgi:TonB C terminal